MSNASGASRFKRIAGKIFKFMSYAVIVLAAALVIAHFAWKYSGSGEWELISDSNGVKIYEMKVPGDSLKKFKANARIKGNPTTAVVAMLDTELKTCSEWIPGCDGVEEVEAWDSKRMSQTYLWHVTFDPKLQPREFLIETKIATDREKQSVFLEFAVLPDKLPRNECCLRISHMRNSWRFTYADEDEIDVEFMQNMNIELPYVLVNAVGPGAVASMFNELPRLLNKPRFQGKKLDFMEGIGP